MAVKSYKLKKNYINSTGYNNVMVALSREYESDHFTRVYICFMSCITLDKVVYLICLTAK